VLIIANYLRIYIYINFQLTTAKPHKAKQKKTKMVQKIRKLNENKKNTNLSQRNAFLKNIEYIFMCVQQVWIHIGIK